MPIGLVVTAVWGLTTFAYMAYAFAFKAEGGAARDRQQTIPCLMFLRVAYLKQVGEHRPVSNKINDPYPRCHALKTWGGGQLVPDRFNLGGKE